MISVDVELALVGLVAMHEPATLISSLLALVLGDRDEAQARRCRRMGRAPHARDRGGGHVRTGDLAAA